MRQSDTRANGWMTMTRSMGVVVLLLLALSGSVLAHNGSVAHAVALPDSIVMDGDLSDWPADIEWHQINRVEYGLPPRSAFDLSASFAVATTPMGDVVYVAVRVQDDVWVPADEYVQWFSCDGVELYFAAPHETHPIQLEIRGTVHVPHNGESVAMRHDGTVRTYEWRVPVAQLKGAEENGIDRLDAEGRILGFDVAVLDDDDPDRFDLTWSGWGHTANKVSFATNMGDLVAAESPDQHGTIDLRVAWPDDSPARRAQVMMGTAGEALDWPRLVDPDGRLQLRLPAGAYALTAGTDTAIVDLQTGATTEIELTATVHQSTRQLGPGTVTTPPVKLSDESWTTFGELSGTSFTSAIAEDSSGGIWVASLRGRQFMLPGDFGVLTHYDKGRVTTYTPADGIIRNITGLHVDRHDRLWMTSVDDGLQSLSGDTLTSYGVVDEHGLDFPSAGSFHGIVEDGDGRLWLSSTRGLAFFDGTRLQRFTQDDGISGFPALASDPNGVWIGNEENVFRMDAHGDITRLDSVRMEAYNGAAAIQAVGNDVWIADKGRLWHFDGEVERDVAIPSERVTSLTVDHEGRPWVGTHGDGLFVYQDSAWTKHSTSDGLVNDQVMNLLVDRRDRVWAVGLAGGVSRNDKAYRRLLTTDDGLGHNLVMSALAASDSSVWLGAYDGYITQVRGDDVQTWKVDEYRGNWGGVVQQIVEDASGTIWARQENILVRLAGESWERVEVGGPVDRLWTFDGELWVTTHEQRRSHLYRLTDGEFRLEHQWPNAARVNLAAAGSTLWLAAFVWEAGPDGRNDVLRWNGSTWTQIDSVAGLARTGGMAGTSGAFGHRVTDMTSVAGRLLVQVYDYKKQKPVHYWFDGQRLSEADLPLTDEDLSLWQEAHTDSRGRVWLASWGNGLLVTDGLVRQRYQRIDGLAHDGTQAVVEDRLGNLWIPTESGASRYRPTDEPPLIRIKDVFAADGSQGAVERIGIPETSDFVRIEFEGSSDFTPRDRMAFVYRLHPDDEWTAHYEPFLELRDMPRGDYTFEVKAVDRDLNYSTEPARLALTIHLPYERMSWAGGLVLAVLLVGWQTARVVKRDKRLSTKNRELTIEGHLERVRAEVASMTGMDGMREVIRVTHDALMESGIQIYGSNYIVIEGETGRAMMYDRESTTDYDMNDDPNGAGVIEHWRRGEVFHRHDGRRWVVDVPSEFGTLAMSRAERPFTDDEIALLQRFAEVAEAGYRRYLDFQHLEEQNDALAKARDTAETANKAKSQFLANMSHEIRTPMNAILGYAQILRRSDDLTGHHRHAVDTIQSSGDHLLNLINDVLDISKIEAGRMELTTSDFDLKQMLETLGVMFEMHCREKQLSWDLEGLSDHAMPVHADEAKLRQVVINLLGNAVKFTKQGSVSLRLTHNPEGASNGQGEHRYRIAVVDTGPGLSAEEQEAIFQPFHQGSAGHESGGTGLGLAITQRHLELMGSELTVTSTPGQGSTFAFDIHLPPADGELSTAPVGEVAGTRRLAEGQQVRVVLADDVRANRDILETMLLDIGADVRTTTNGREALEAVQADRPDIVFLDVRMPVMDGLESVQQMRQLEDFDDLKAVAISASVLEHERQGYLESGFDDFIDKPFHFDRVCQALTEQLGVRFEEADTQRAKDEADGESFGEAQVSQDLRDRLIEAAELYSVTEIEQLSGELAQAGDVEARLAERLRQLSQAQDMDGIIGLLQRVPAHA